MSNVIIFAQKIRKKAGKKLPDAVLRVFRVLRVLRVSWVDQFF
jgi:hypothetical protein